MADNIDNEIAALMKGTKAHLVSDVSSAVMHDREKVETPIPALNCILGGGIPMGIIIEAFGVPASGKSSTWYQTMGNFQKQYPKGISIVVDTEASVDSKRMPFMGCDPNRTLRIPATSIEEGFGNVFDILDRKVKNPELKDLPVFIIWDTIGIGVTEKELETSDQFSSGMMAHAKLIKHELSVLLPRIEEQPIIVVLLNQVTTQVGMYTSGLTSGGGWGIKHNAHLRLRYNDGKTDYNGIYAIRKHSSIDMVKSKVSPLFENIPLSIDITKGGIVDGASSFLDYCRNSLGYISNTAWSNMDPIVKRHPEWVGKFGKFIDPDKSFRYDELVEYCKNRPKLITALEICFIEDISNQYTYQSEICKPYLDKLIDKLNEPELFTDNDGTIIDKWTGEIVSKASNEEIDKEISSDANEVLNSINN